MTTNGVTTIRGAGAGQFGNSWGQTVIGAGIPAGATVVDVSLDGSTATLSSPATQDGTTVPVWVGVTYDQAVSEINQNNSLAAALALPNFSQTNLIQPDISGLTNQNFLQAAYDRGVRYLISDTSRTGDPRAFGVNEGSWNIGTYDSTLPGAATANPHGTNWKLLELARYPTNLYFNVRTPAQWLAEDNCLYPAGAFGHVTTYQQLIDRESTVLAKYLLEGANRPLMFHQTNLAAYSGGHSLFSDLMDAALSKYSALVKVAGAQPDDEPARAEAIRPDGLQPGVGHRPVGQHRAGCVHHHHQQLGGPGQGTGNRTQRRICVRRGAVRGAEHLLCSCRGRAVRDPSAPLNGRVVGPARRAGPTTTGTTTYQSGG